MQPLTPISPRVWTGQAGCRLHRAGVDAIGCAFNDGGPAGEGAKGAEDASARRFEQRLAAFIFERERRGGTGSGSEEVAEMLRNVAVGDGESFACELLDLARQAGDFDVTDFEVYREVASTPLNA
ncbi:hypothetical protein [Paraburkholderia phenoliruptrix]|uniref:hypothetical protein n=1 Tax=Paraburkholderia phenoliruptrix TaxID=252970 RepID=UPI002869973B|nr:hypothetical protein [Paraburkholderia phenoliruptrix]WMY11093.1 hypothetical protein P3F88_31035 [Paraburkholderia phenoliruptrix]